MLYQFPTAGLDSAGAWLGVGCANDLLLRKAGYLVSVVSLAHSPKPRACLLSSLLSGLDAVWVSVSGVRFVCVCWVAEGISPLGPDHIDVCKDKLELPGASGIPVSQPS